jgi:hypothetical protein
MYTRKTTDEYIVQGNYSQGWEDETTEETWREGMRRLKEYRDNMPEYPHRLIKKRIKL